MTAERLIAELDRLQIERAVAIQRGRVYGYDNRYVCDMAESHPRRIVAVCSVDMTGPRSGEQARHWIRARHAAGIRLMEPVKGSDLSWLDSTGAQEVWKAATDCGVPVGVHFFPWNRQAGTAALARILREFSEVTVVLDNLSGLAVEAGAPDYGIDDALRVLADIPRVHAKFSGMILSRLAAAKIPAGPMLERMIALFGAGRILWGSDLLAAGQSYAQSVQLAREATRGLERAVQCQLLRETSAALYPVR